jgi:cleavage and polyadenylation specificity factor subunit 1
MVSHFFTDTIGLFDTETTETTPAAAHTDKNTSTLHAAVAIGNRSQWLVLMRPQGVMEVGLTSTIWDNVS